MTTVYELIEANGLTLHGDIEHFAELVRADEREHMTEEDDDIQQYVRPWVGLTDEEVSKIIDAEIGFNSCWGPEEDFARAIEAKLKEKNT